MNHTYREIKELLDILSEEALDQIALVRCAERTSPNDADSVIVKTFAVTGLVNLDVYNCWSNGPPPEKQPVLTAKNLGWVCVESEVEDDIS